MITAALSNIGKIRKENQDAYAVRRVSDDIVFAVVCDGMGGANGGSIASHMACDSLMEVLEKNFRSRGDIRGIIRKAVNHANSIVFDASLNDPTLSGMGTTMVLAIVNGDDLYIANVGDSRAYLLTNDALTQISTDHSAVQELVDLGKITKEEARVHPQKNLITRAIGVDDFVKFDFYSYPLEKSDIVLLCSDGLSNFCGDETLKDILGSGKEPEAVVRDLVDHANEEGGRDNITALIIKR